MMTVVGHKVVGSKIVPVVVDEVSCQMCWTTAVSSCGSLPRDRTVTCDRLTAHVVPVMSKKGKIRKFL